MSDQELKIDLPSGGWALFKDPGTVTYGQRRVLQKVSARLGARANMAEGSTGATLDISADSLAEVLVQSDEVLVAILIAEWSFEAPVPTADNLTALYELHPHDVDALIHKAEELRSQLFLDVSPTPDRDSPTQPSQE